MISIIKRVSLARKKDPLELLALWDECVEDAKESGYGRLDSTTYAVAASLFSERTGTSFNLEKVKRLSRGDIRQLTGTEIYANPPATNFNQF